MSSGSPATQFAPGHSVTVKHGAWSERITNPIIMELVDGVLAYRPDLQRYPPAVYAWASHESKVIVLEQWLDENGLFDAKGKPRTTVLDLVSRFARLARESRTELGLSPKAEADIAKARIDAQTATFDLDAVLARGRQVIEANGTGQGGTSLPPAPAASTSSLTAGRVS